MQTKVKKKNERDEFLVFCEGELERSKGWCRRYIMALTDEIQKVGGSTEQELCDRKIYWWFEDEKDLKDDLEWQEKKSESNENGSDWQVSGDLDTAEIWSEKVRLLSKMTPRLRAESIGERMTSLGKWMVGWFSFSSCFGRPMTRNSVFEGLRERKLDDIQL